VREGEKEEGILSGANLTRRMSFLRSRVYLEEERGREGGRDGGWVSMGIENRQRGRGGRDEHREDAALRGGIGRI